MRLRTPVQDGERPAGLLAPLKYSDERGESPAPRWKGCDAMEAVREAAGRSCVEDEVPAVVEPKEGALCERGDELEAELIVDEVTLERGGG